MTTRGRVEHAPDTVAGRRVGTLNARQAPMKGRPSSVTGRKHACHALIGAAASAGEIFRHSASSRACAPSSAATWAGLTGSGPTVEIAHTHVVPSARGNNSGVRISPLASRCSRNSASAGMAHPSQTAGYGPCSQAPPAAGASARRGSTTVPSRSRQRRLRRSRRSRDAAHCAARAAHQKRAVARRRECLLRLRTRSFTPGTARGRAR